MNIHYMYFKLFLPYFYINLHHFYFITFLMTLNFSLHVITSLYMRNLMLGFVLNCFYLVFTIFLPCFYSILNFLPCFYINIHHFYFITFVMTFNLSLHVITSESLYMRNLMLGLVFVVHSHSAQRSWENTLKTIHLDGCCLLSCVWSWIHVGCSRGQFQGGEGRWADDGMQW
jgi:hypothetical protein